MDTAAEFDLGYLPMNRKEPGIDEQLRLKEIYAKLIKQRKTRLVPKDDKLLAGLNGVTKKSTSHMVAQATACDLIKREPQPLGQLGIMMMFFNFKYRPLEKP